MIEIICDNCERPLEVDDEQAGGKVSCPHCGDINRVPAIAAAAGAAGAAAATAAAAPAPAEPAPPAPPAPPAETKAADLPREDAPEQEIRVVRPAMFRAHPLRGVAIVLLVLAGIVGAIWSRRQEFHVAVTYLALAVSVFGLGWLAKWWIATTLWIKVTITNKRTIRHEGIVRRHSTEVLHDHVRSVDINQNFLQRVMKVGYIGIDSAGQDGIEIEIRDIPAPYEIKRIIDQYRKM